jgi:hypothetical protein
VAWEYRENAISVGAMYKSALEVCSEEVVHPYSAERVQGSEEFSTYI